MQMGWNLLSFNMERKISGVESFISVFANYWVLTPVAISTLLQSLKWQEELAYSYNSLCSSWLSWMKSRSKPTPSMLTSQRILKRKISFQIETGGPLGSSRSAQLWKEVLNLTSSNWDGWSVRKSQRDFEIWDDELQSNRARIRAWYIGCDSLSFRRGNGKEWCER